MVISYNKWINTHIIHQLILCYFDDAIINRLLDYESWLVNNKLGAVGLHASVRDFRVALKKMFDAYYVGHQNEAYNSFKSAFETLIGNSLFVKSMLLTISL